jgi:hypothetical protein
MISHRRLTAEGQLKLEEFCRKSSTNLIESILPEFLHFSTAQFPGRRVSIVQLSFGEGNLYNIYFAASSKGRWYAIIKVCWSLQAIIGRKEL